VTFTEAVGQRIKAQRKKREWTFARLAKEVGLSVSHVSQLEKGDRTFNVIVLHWFAKVFEMSVSALLADIEREVSPGAGGAPGHKAD